MQRNFPIWLIVVLILIVGVLVFNVIGQPPAEISEDPIKIDKSQFQTAPDFTLTDLAGNTVSLTDYKGKNIYLNFWASWCGPCKMEMPDIEKIYQEYKDKDLIVLAVDVGENMDTVNDFVTANQFNFSVLLDPKGSVAKTYKVSSIPVSIFINKEGLIVSKKIGLMTHAQMQAYVSELYR